MNHYREGNLARRIFRTNTSGYRGVYQTGTTWRAMLMSNGTRFSWSNCATIEEAAAAYNSLARHHHGTHAQLNALPDGFPQFLDIAVSGRKGRRSHPRKRDTARTLRDLITSVAQPQDRLEWAIGLAWEDINCPESVPPIVATDGVEDSWKTR